MYNRGQYYDFGALSINVILKAISAVHIPIIIGSYATQKHICHPHPHTPLTFLKF